MLVNTKINRTNYYEGNAGSSNAEAEKKGWYSLWKTMVPSKIRVFLWRLAQQSLPTTDVLDHRHMSTHSNSALCGNTDSWRQSLVDCNMTQAVWALSEETMVEKLTINRETNARQCMFDLMKSLPHDQFTRVVVTLWAIWMARRKAIHEDIYQSGLWFY
jgi:hypothetical protein